MNGKELVMAILCLPLSGREVLSTEKEYDVIIYRKIIYDRQAGAEALVQHLKKLSVPLKFLFIFGTKDCLLVNSMDDMTNAMHRLLSLS